MRFWSYCIIFEKKLVMELESINLGQLYNPHQYLSVPSGESKTVFYFKVPSGKVLFIDRIANNWFTGIEWEFIIDGERVYSKIEREIAPINQPEKYEPPFLCVGYVKWIFHNNSSSAITAEVFCDGSLHSCITKKIL